MATLSDPTQTYQTGFDPNTGLFLFKQFNWRNVVGRARSIISANYQRGFDVKYW